MAVKRWELWNAPSGSINAAQRAQATVGYSLSTVSVVISTASSAVSRWELLNAPSGSINAAQRSQILVGFSRGISAAGLGGASLHSRSGKKGIRGTAWETCSRCGRDYPLPQVGYQNGVLVVCKTRCWDNPAKLTSAWRDRQIADILSQGAEQEGMDLRFLDEVMASQNEENW